MRSVYSACCSGVITGPIAILVHFPFLLKTSDGNFSCRSLHQSSRAVFGADTPLQQTLITPEQIKALIALVNFLEISRKPGILIEKILGESGKVRDNRLNSYKNDLFGQLLRDFENLKSVLIDKILQKRLVNRQNFATCGEVDLLVDKI